MRTKCFVCSSYVQDWVTVNNYTIKRCPACKTGILDPIPNEATLQAYYDEYFDKYPQRSVEHNNFKKLERHYTKIDEQRLDRMEKALGKKLIYAHLLDIGCANGLFMKNAQERGMSVEGIEICEAEARQAHDLTTATIHASVLEKLDLPSNYYDAVTGWDVFEHVPDPQKFIKEIHRILKPGGVVGLATINVAGLNRVVFGERWGFFIPPEHTVYYDVQAMKRWFHDNDFTVKRVRTYYAPQLSWQGLSLLLRKDEQVIGFNTPESKLLLTIKKIVAGIINFPLQFTKYGDIIELYAVKNDPDTTQA